ncbi:hypothetical protein J3R83DRAFT_12129 [Lanmaoa asiatica]|nr:hypothetical protein J3R83DRAFT_12129 [Lanmaoa asiatica]
MDPACYMIPDGCNTPHEDPQHQTPLANVSTQSPTARKAVLPDAKSGSSSLFSKSYSMTSPSDVPPRPSTAPPHPSSDAIKGKDSQTDLQTRTTLVSNLRARNLLLQRAISHIDDAVLHLMAARSGIPSSKIQQVRGEARNRKDLLDRVDRAIKMAQNGEIYEGSQGGDTSEGARSGPGGERPSTESGSANILQAEALSGTTSPNVAHPLPSDASLDTPQLRRSSSQPQLGPSTGQPQVPTKIYTLPELTERRKALQESIESWRNFAAELRAAQPHLEAQARSAPALPAVVSTQASAATTTPSTQTQEPSWTVKYQRAQFEIKRREDLLLRLNQAITQLSHPNPEQFAALASYIPPALDKPRFDAAYAHFCQGKSIQMNTTIIMPDVSRPVIDVYSLHVAVMQEGSFIRVSGRKYWDVVGARLGFIQTAATATEPARSSPEIAVHLEKAYRDRLQQFDHLYVTSVVETVRKRMAEQQKKP